MLVTKENGTMSIYTQIKLLYQNPVFDCLVLGFGAYAFTVGGLSYWGPDFIQKHFDQTANVATLSLGGITVICGLVATLSGS